MIGAGFGGLASAIRLRALGFSVLLLDRGGRPGGRARVFAQDGFRFDAGPTVITAPHLIDELFTRLGERRADHITLLPVTPWYRILFASGRRFDYGGDAATMIDSVGRFAPGDVAGYRRFRRYAERMFVVGFERYGGIPFHGLGTALGALPRIVRHGGVRSLYATVARHLRDPELRQVFTLQTLLIGGHPFRTSAIYALIGHLEARWGVWFVRGGTGVLVDALLSMAERHGIRWRPNATVTRILHERGRVAGVRLAGGETLAADLVVANTDALTVGPELLGRRSWRPIRLSMGLFVFCFGTDRRYDAVAHHTMVLGPDYQALLDLVFDGADAPPTRPSLYLHRPAATDPDAAPPGLDVFYVLAPVPNLRSPIDWARATGPFRDRIVAILAERVLPDLGQHIVSERIMTPQDFAEDYGSVAGAGFSAAPVLSQSAPFRPSNRVRGIDGLLLAGAGTHPGAGLPGVLLSGVIVETLARDWLRRRAPDPVRTLARHGRSFRLAGRFLSRRVLRDAATLYRFCRTVDDLADLATDARRAAHRLGAIRAALVNDVVADPDAGPLLMLARRRALDLAPALALIDTVQADLAPRALPDERALLAYADGAAGTVGRMMCDLLTGGDRTAMPEAAALGIAMQLTNIARDVAEDAARGRLYLPLTALPPGTSTANLLEPERRAAVFNAVEAVLERADRHYAFAERGYNRLPWRSRLAIRAAARLYRAIGAAVRARGPAYLDGPRAIVRGPERFALLLSAAVLPRRRANDGGERQQGETDHDDAAAILPAAAPAGRRRRRAA